MNGYFGILPQNIRHDKNIKPLSKLLYCEITANLNDDGICTKRNVYFSKVMEITKAYVSRCLTELRKNGFIDVEIQLQKGTQKFIKRYITPTNFSGGVNELLNNTHADNQIGVNGSSPQGSSIDPSEYQATLLYNNNTINTRYIDPKIKHTPINKKITPEQLDMLTGIVTNFLLKQKKKFPHLFTNKDEKELLNQSINELYNIITIDKVDYKLLDEVLKWVLEHKFWHSKITFLHTLRHKSVGNGNKKFENILTDYQSQKEK
jgi:hypothetical protein